MDRLGSCLSLGNHEFDDKPAGLAPFLQSTTFPVLAANLNITLAPELKDLKSSVIIEKNGVKIGIIGYLTPDTVILASPPPVTFFDEVPMVKLESERLDKEGVKIIIALGHSGFLMDQEIAAKVPLVDIVVGGHTNTFLYNGKGPDSEEAEGLYPTVVSQKTGKKVPVVQAYAYTKYLGVLNVTFNDKGDLMDFQGQPMLLDHTIPQQEDVLQRLEVYRSDVDDLINEVVGKTNVMLEGEKCRLEECNLGNLFVDAMVFYAQSLSRLNDSWSDTPLSIINGGAIRASVDPHNRHGNITQEDLITITPYDSQVVTLSITGKELLQVLEFGVRSNGETSRGEFLQVSGIKYKADLTKPPMSRITSVDVRCGNCLIPRYSKLNLEAHYKLVTTDFIAEGGDGYEILKKANKTYLEVNDITVLKWYISRYSPVYAEIQGRITLKTSDNSSTVNKLSLVVLLFSLIVKSLF